MQLRGFLLIVCIAVLLPWRGHHVTTADAATADAVAAAVAASGPPPSAPESAFPLSTYIFGATTTMTTTMAPQKEHPMGDRSGGGGGGFINQHLKLITLLTIAIHLRVNTVMLPPAKSRDSFEQAEPSWKDEHAASLWDLSSIQKLLAKYNITVETSATADEPPLDALVLPTYFCRALEIGVVADEVRRLGRAHVASFAAKPAHITIFAPDLILALQTNKLPLYAEVSAAVRFAPRLMSLANAISSKLRKEASHFNGMHLRVEGDFREVHNQTIAEGLAAYMSHIVRLNFTNVPVYVASGIFMEGGHIDEQRYKEVDRWFRQQVVGQGYASRIVNRRMLVHDVMATGKFRRLHSEQRAAVDFIVLMRANKLIGTRMSSFSFLLQEFRALQGIPRHTTGTVGEPWKLFVVATGVAA